MLTVLLHLIVRLCVTLLPSDTIEALQRTAPEPITASAAGENIIAARIAGIVYTVDPDLLLSLAAHESNYQANAVTVEIHGVSCGVMTPEPLAKCVPQTTIEGYLAGAKHLRTWIDAAKGNMQLALTGYAGGYVLIEACKNGPYIHTRKNGTQVNACLTPNVFEWRRAWIKRERQKTTKVS